MARRTLAMLILAGLALNAPAAPPAKVYVVLWFDTEDYILPASDDAALRLANWLDKEGIRATFKIVGEKARTLEMRGRKDVIAALNKHEIGYHANWHSVQPTPAMYLSNLGWDEGVAEFDRREGSGVADVKRIFGRLPTCYGQPGSSWGPQSFGAMQKWGVNIYLDAGKHISLDGRPHYYCGLLTLYNLSHTIRTNLGGEKDLRAAEDRFLEARKKLLDEGGGVVSIVYHPCEFVHEKFWDGVNFNKGANPPREEWKVPPQKTDEASKVAYDTFEAYLRFIQRFPEVQFVTATDLAKVYRDPAKGRNFGRADVERIIDQVGAEVSFQRHEGFTLSAAEAFAVMNAAFCTHPAVRDFVVKLDASPLGPTGETVVMPESVATDASQFLRTAADVQSYLRHHGRVPSIVWLGSKPVTPEAYFITLAKMLKLKLDSKPLPESIALAPAKLAVARHAFPDDPSLWGWVIFPPGFRAPLMMDLARKQTWTIKPAINHGPAEPKP